MFTHNALQEACLRRCTIQIDIYFTLLATQDFRRKKNKDLIVTRMSKHASTLLARETVEVLVNEHVIVEAVLPRERRVTDQTDKRLYTYNM